MKNLFLLLMIAAIVSLNSCCQEPDGLPEKVKTNFAEKFPDAKKVKWEEEEDNEWEAEFKMDGKEYSTAYTSEGKWLETEYEITENELSTVVKSTMDNEFTGFEIEEIELIKSPKGKFFEFEIEKEEGNEEIKMEVLIDANGKVQKKEIIEEEDDDDDE